MKNIFNSDWDFNKTFFVLIYFFPLINLISIGGLGRKKICSLLCFSFLTLEGAESATLLKLTMHVSEAPPIDKTEKFKNLSLQNGNFSKCYGKVVVVTSPSHLKNNIFDSTYIEIRVELFTFFHSFHLTKKNTISHQTFNVEISSRSRKTWNYIFFVFFYTH